MTADKRLHPDDEAALAALFDDLHDRSPLPSRDFMRRVMADADAVMAGAAPAAAKAPAKARAKTRAKPAAQKAAQNVVQKAAPRGPGFLSRLLATSFGRTAGGMVMAAALGFGVGLSGAISGAPWLGQVAPLLFATDSDTALTLLPDADSFVIALSDDTEAGQ